MRSMCDPLQDTMVSMFRDGATLVCWHEHTLAGLRDPAVLRERFVSMRQNGTNVTLPEPATLFDHDERELVVHPLLCFRAERDTTDQPSALFYACTGVLQVVEPYYFATDDARWEVYTTMCLNC